MFMPAQHLPISLIGSMWNPGSRWSSPEEGGICGGGKCGGVLWHWCDVKPQITIYDWKLKYKYEDVRTIMILYDAHM